MNIYHETNEFLEACFHTLEAPAPSPVPVKEGDGFVLRYKEEHQCSEIAIIQKLARYISGLNASLSLLEDGFTQELGAIFRMLDEFSEDIMFLSLPNVGSFERTKIHEEYLEQFFQEEFDTPGNAILSTQKRKTISREKIRSVVSGAGKSGLNPNDAREVSRTLSKAYSGYVHGASGHILEMVDGDPLRYYLSGMTGTSRQTEFKYNYWDYAYRGLLSVVLAAKALGESDVVDNGYKFIKYFEQVTGDTGTGDAEKLMKKIKRKNA